MSWNAEVVFITSNYQGNKEIMEGCKAIGIPAFVRHHSSHGFSPAFAKVLPNFGLGHSMGLLNSHSLFRVWCAVVMRTHGRSTTISLERHLRSKSIIIVAILIASLLLVCYIYFIYVTAPSVYRTCYGLRKLNCIHVLRQRLHYYITVDINLYQYQ